MSESKHRKPIHIVYPNMWPSIVQKERGSGEGGALRDWKLFFRYVAALNTKSMSKSHGRMWGNPFGAVRGQTLFPWTRVYMQCAHYRTCVRMWSTGSVLSRTQMPMHYSHLSERVLLGSCDTLGFFFLTAKSSWGITTLNRIWKKLFLIFIWPLP